MLWQAASNRSSNGLPSSRTSRWLNCEFGWQGRRWWLVNRRSRGFSIISISPLKKSLHAAEQDRPDVAAARRAWRREQAKLDPRRLVFIDETSASTNMTRRYGRGKRGARLVYKVPHGPLEDLDLHCGPAP